MQQKIAAYIVVTVFLSGTAIFSAEQPKKVHRIGYISSTDRASDARRFEPFRAALRDLGYVEGQNIHIEYRYAEGKRERQPELASELARLNLDILVVQGGDTVIRAAMKATKTIPILMTGQGGDPVKQGFVQSLARPGGNVTGITFLTTELGSKRLELLKEAVPNLSRVAILYDPAAPAITRELKEDLPVAARALKLAVQPWEVRTVEDFDKIFAALTKKRPDGLYAPSAGALMSVNQKRIATFALKSRVPSMYSNRAAVEAGGLMSYSADVGHSYQRIAYFVDRIVKGAKPADLPVEQPMKFEFVINLKTVNEIRLKIPPDLLARATRIIR